MAAATYDLTVGSTALASGVSNQVVGEKIVDFTSDPVGSAETVDLIVIPAQTWVQGVSVEVETPEGAADTIDIGDADTENLYLNDKSLVAAAFFSSDINAKFYSVANTIRLLANATLAAAKIRVKAVMVMTPNKAA